MILGAFFGAAFGTLDGALRKLFIGDFGWQIFWALDDSFHVVDRNAINWSYSWHPQALVVCGVIGSLIGACVGACLALILKISKGQRASETK
jgi:hypothetical protein